MMMKRNAKEEKGEGRWRRKRDRKIEKNEEEKKKKEKKKKGDTFNPKLRNSHTSGTP